MTIIRNVFELIGNTPLIRLNHISKETGAEIIGKAEFFNPLSSVKDRIALATIVAAERDGSLKPGGVVVEGTSGNTGIALAYICAAKGYKLILAMPESMSVERRGMLRAFGAELVLTPASEGMPGANRKAAEIAEEIEGAVLIRQFENPANPEIHERTTAEEIWEACNGKLDAVVVGVGTGGTLTGLGRNLKDRNRAIKVFAVEPVNSPVISGGEPGPHKIQGIGAGFIPKNLDTSLIDDVIKIEDEEAFQMSRRLAKEEGLCVGISAGGNVAAAAKVARRPEFQGKRIVTILCDTGERYLSTPLFSEES